MDKIAKRFIDICRLKAGPQDLPTSRFLLAILLLAYGMLVLFLSAGEKEPAMAIQVAVVAVVILAGLTYIVLWVRDLTARYVQTLTAITGCYAFLELGRWPLMMLQQYGADGGGTFFVVVAAVLLWSWLIWEVAIIAHIFKHALDTSIWMGVIISFFYVFLFFRVMRTLFFTTEVAATVPVT